MITVQGATTETRKVQSVGGGTYTVSLPKAWADEQDVDTGQVVTLHTHFDGVLVLQANDPDGPSGRLTVQVSAGPDAVERTLRAAYAAGATEIVLESADEFSQAQRRAAERVSNALTGVTVTDADDSRLVVRTLLDPGDVSVRQTVRQLEYVALGMHRDAIAGVLGDAAVESVASRGEQANRLYALVDRHFDRALSRLDEVDALALTRTDLLTLRETARELAGVADHAETIATHATDVTVADSALAEDVEELARTARDAIEDAVSVTLEDATGETAQRALSTRDRVRTSANALDRRVFNAADAEYRLIRVLDHVRRTAERGGTIAELGLRHSIRGDDPVRVTSGES